MLEHSPQSSLVGIWYIHAGSDVLPRPSIYWGLLPTSTSLPSNQTGPSRHHPLGIRPELCTCLLLLLRHSRQLPPTVSRCAQHSQGRCHHHLSAAHQQTSGERTTLLPNLVPLLSTITMSLILFVHIHALYMTSFPCPFNSWKGRQGF